MQKLGEAAKVIAEVYNGKRPMYHLQEAMTTSDFPFLFGDILDRQILAAYREWPTTWQNYAKRGRVRDFRTAKRFGVYGADQVLGAVVGQKGEYPYEEINEDTPFSLSVSKYGRKIRFGWETMINDDLDALKDQPERLGRAARRSEEKYTTQLFVDASGPHASFYTGGNKNQIITANGAATNNPALSIAALQDGFKVLAAIKDQNGEPIVIETVELVVPPALEITALNILNALQIEITEAGGTSAQKLIAVNWMKGRTRLNVNPYIPIVASTANGSTSWFLFANPDNGRPALEVAFLIGHEEPEVFMKVPNQVRVGGGAPDVMDGDFETDSIEHKLRHVFGGTRMDPKMTVASNGSGS
ncbi:MAG: Mu-like prophage major head subunit gpT family protein [Anaerolineae bacterium]|nr:Mu-like prophage major head subunit gpT family protein [Anaerolineae bacterium]